VPQQDVQIGTNLTDAGYFSGQAGDNLQAWCMRLILLGYQGATQFDETQI
jgi:hypothetical protein